MDFLEGVLATILSFFLLISIIATSQYLKPRFELLSDMDEDLRLEINILEICDQEQDINNLLYKVIDFLNYNGIKWSIIELFSEEQGKIVSENEKIFIEFEEQVRYVRVLRITSEDVLYITIGIKND
ncbi:MAG: hypothetical protein QXR44_00930 [Thermoproteota archaeon]